jgi:hypothetical protein
MFFSDGLAPGRRELEKHWNHGFSNCKLVRQGHIQYVAKYIGKDTRRIHASQLLGLRLGTGTETSPHPMWYLNLRRKRQMKPIISTVTNPHINQNDLDPMERSIEDLALQERPNEDLNDVSLVAEGPLAAQTSKDSGRLG